MSTSVHSPHSLLLGLSDSLHWFDQVAFVVFVRSFSLLPSPLLFLLSLPSFPSPRSLFSSGAYSIDHSSTCLPPEKPVSPKLSPRGLPFNALHSSLSRPKQAPFVEPIRQTSTPKGNDEAKATHWGLARLGTGAFSVSVPSLLAQESWGRVAIRCGSGYCPSSDVQHFI